ncbi:hypothetical protein M1446_05580 [Candidatus Dependentiae bacterium]|nr:hypothetical protein [Candidatus Dependentiae bacterium]
MNKRLFLNLFVILQILHLPLIAEQAQNSKLEKVKQSISKLKAPAKFVGAVGAAFGTHLLSANVIFSFFKPKFDKTNNDLSYLFGLPTNLILKSYFLTIAFQVLEAKLEKKTLKYGIKNGLKKPFIVHQEIADKISETISKKDLNISFKNTFFLTLASLQSGSLLAQFIHGFTPIGTKNSTGTKLWKKFGLERDMTIKSPNQIIIEGLTPLLLSTSYGVAKGIHSLIKNKN